MLHQQIKAKLGAAARSAVDEYTIPDDTAIIARPGLGHPCQPKDIATGGNGAKCLDAGLHGRRRAVNAAQMGIAVGPMDHMQTALGADPHFGWSKAKDVTH